MSLISAATTVVQSKYETRRPPYYAPKIGGVGEYSYTQISDRRCCRFVESKIASFVRSFVYLFGTACLAVFAYD